VTHSLEASMQSQECQFLVKSHYKLTRGSHNHIKATRSSSCRSGKPNSVWETWFSRRILRSGKPVVNYKGTRRGAHVNQWYLHNGYKHTWTFKEFPSPTPETRNWSIHKFLLATCLLAGSCWIFFDPEDGGDMFLRNVGCISTDYTASHPRRWYSS
jgi:hypothetical protein